MRLSSQQWACGLLVIIWYMLINDVFIIFASTFLGRTLRYHRIIKCFAKHLFTMQPFAKLLQWVGSWHSRGLSEGHYWWITTRERWGTNWRTWSPFFLVLGSLILGLTFSLFSKLVKLSFHQSFLKLTHQTMSMYIYCYLIVILSWYYSYVAHYFCLLHSKVLLIKMFKTLTISQLLWICFTEVYLVSLVNVQSKIEKSEIGICTQNYFNDFVCCKRFIVTQNNQMCCLAP